MTLTADLLTSTVLLVEDDAAVRTLVAELVERLGFHVLVARDPLEAIEIAGRPIVIDVLLTDVALPGMNGRDLAQIVAGDRPALRVLFTSGDLLAAAADESFLAKPFEARDLARALRNLLEDERPAA